MPNQFVSKLHKAGEHLFRVVLVICVGAVAAVTAASQKEIPGYQRYYDTGLVSFRFKNRNYIVYQFFLRLPGV